MKMSELSVAARSVSHVLTRTMDIVEIRHETGLPTTEIKKILVVAAAFGVIVIKCDPTSGTLRYSKSSAYGKKK